MQRMEVMRKASSHFHMLWSRGDPFSFLLRKGSLSVKCWRESYYYQLTGSLDPLVQFPNTSVLCSNFVRPMT